MINKILAYFGYVPKKQLDEANTLIDTSSITLERNVYTIHKLTTKLADQAKNYDNLVRVSETKIKKLTKNNIRLLKKQGEFKERIKALEKKLNAYERQSTN